MARGCIQVGVNPAIYSDVRYTAADCPGEFSMRRLAPIGLGVAGVVALLGLVTFALAQGRGGTGSSPEEQANLAGESISEYQQAVLADGVVTDEDMRDAVAATVACIRAQGYHANVPPSGEPGQVDRVILVVGPEGEVDPDGPVNEVVAACRAEFMERVDREYARQSAPPPEAADTLAQRFAECMTDAGYPPAPGELVFTTARMNEVSQTREGLAALDACLRAPPP